MKRIFNSDYGVFCCPHVFHQEKPILLVVRDDDGDWQFLCGYDTFGPDQNCHLVGMGHLLERDASLADLVNLEPSNGVERDTINQAWKYFNLND
jgi:hypothetical protein